ncbi:hypothetical protein CMESO_451 (nucleomorph) [Chroomonas mesostigmatica CCMP1168]|uniref:Uncharacterized protein n=1 Tax=Chroomonas mesostigmatica CCMP1168 TaxID=1195612 RepID=J7G2B4_9CRYP|nr:hypothetical protein CMESO_451 [Chroomonas mesostigmatica CCMP1168]|mmetsp:Transcript_58804/g.144130  ORF Transcript_58804/g.144130 Transcript_58804/m.144130 type:complete len:283 (+) Transcript_58804:4383-5231(+)
MFNRTHENIFIKKKKPDYQSFFLLKSNENSVHEKKNAFLSFPGYPFKENQVFSFYTPVEKLFLKLKKKNPNQFENSHDFFLINSNNKKKFFKNSQIKNLSILKKTTTIFDSLISTEKLFDKPIKLKSFSFIRENTKKIKLNLKRKLNNPYALYQFGEFLYFRFKDFENKKSPKRIRSSIYFHFDKNFYFLFFLLKKIKQLYLTMRIGTNFFFKDISVFLFFKYLFFKNNTTPLIIYFIYFLYYNYFHKLGFYDSSFKNVSNKDYELFGRLIREFTPSLGVFL